MQIQWTAYHGGRPHGVLVVWRVPQLSQHAHTSVFDVSAPRVLVLVDEVLPRRQLSRISVIERRQVEFNSLPLTTGTQAESRRPRANCI